MDDGYARNAGLLKALSDRNRLMIVDILSCGEMCACKILERFDITQPTLSHHMGILCGSGLVNGRKEGKWMYYSLDPEAVKELLGYMGRITSAKDDCICR